MTIAAPSPEFQTDDPEELPSGALEDRIPPPLRSAMKRQGFEELTAVQRAVLETLADGRDLLISSQTGSGKTVALGISMAKELIEAGPSIRGTGPSVVVITPTRELASQVQKELSWLYAEVPSVSVTVVTGGTSLSQERRQLARGPRIVVGTPGRMLDHIRSKALDCSETNQVVLDEADQMLDMGFREELEGIIETTPAERRTHLISATFPAAIRKLAQRFQKDPIHIEGTRLGESNQDIEHVAHLVREEDRYAALVNLILLAGDSRTLVFVNTRAAAAEVAQSLFDDGFSAMPLSGELAQAQRTRTLTAFRTGSIKVLVATDVAARGLDIPEVGLVVHAGPPEDSEAYVHRSGRTGRAGRKGRCVMLVTPRSRRFVQRILNEARIDIDWRDVPTADRVRREFASAERLLLAAAIDEGKDVGTEQYAHAEELLADRDAIDVVAALLAAVRKKGVREPMDLEPVVVNDKYEKPRRDKGRFEDKRAPKGAPFKAGGKKGSFKQAAPYPGDAQPFQARKKPSFQERAKPSFHENSKKGAPRGGPRSRGGDFELFQISWGFKSGANPSRLVATICRRGQISSNMIGTIDIDAHRSVFEVSRSHARQFEELASRHDARDPKIHIKRAEGASRR